MILRLVVSTVFVTAWALLSPIAPMGTIWGVRSEYFFVLFVLVWASQREDIPARVGVAIDTVAFLVWMAIWYFLASRDMPKGEALPYMLFLTFFVYLPASAYFYRNLESQEEEPLRGSSVSSADDVLKRFRR